LAAATALTAAISAITWFAAPASVIAGGETRTLQLYHVHTKESLTVTYMVNGRYVPSAMKKVNYFLRDWRRNETTRIDPKTVDLMWELHADLGSKKPIHIISGYRSAKTNNFLKRVGRNVAKKSQHIAGRAIDLYFPDVKTKTIRNSALVRQIGGVGYYRSSGGPSGFVHIDSGRVRHWGPAISRTEMASIFRDYRKTVGARLGGKYQPAPVSEPTPAENNIAYEGMDEDTDEGVSAKVQATPRQKPAVAAETAPMEMAKAIVPTPREKPIEVLMMAAASMQIIPASAPPEKQVYNSKPRPVANNAIGVVEAAETLVEEPSFDQPVSNRSAKGSFAEALRNGTAEGTPLIKPLAATAAGTDLFVSSPEVVFNPDQTIRRDGEPQEFVAEAQDPAAAAKAAMAANQPTRLALASVLPIPAASGKGDMLQVNRSSKGSLMNEQPAPVARKKAKKLGENAN
jgi:uncharacterized protein YcbK (DUF882 family)